MSATPSCTVCGMSSSRRKRASAGKPVDWATRRPLPMLNLMPDSFIRAMLSSCRRPFFCMAIFKVVSVSMVFVLCLVLIRIDQSKLRFLGEQKKAYHRVSLLEYYSTQQAHPLYQEMMMSVAVMNKKHVD